MRQYLKPNKWDFKWWFRCESSNGYLYEFDLCLGKKQKVEVNLGKDIVMQCSFVKNSKAYFALCFLITFSIAHY